MNFVHFTGNGKPWNYDRTVFEKQLNRIKNKTNMNNYGDYEYWYWLLQDALEKTDFKHKVSLDFITSERKQPSVGKTPSFDQRAQYMRRKAYNGWRQYEYEERDISQMIDEVSTDLSTAGDIIRKSIVDGEGMGTKLPPSSLSTESGLEAKDLVNMLEHFQPRTALKPFLPQLKKIQDDLDSSSSFDALASSSLQNSDTTAETSLLHDEATDPRRWAYAFLLGGARSNREGTEYLTGLYSVVASAYQIRKLGSKADVILMVQIAAESPHRKLMESEEEILQKMDIKIVYVPKFADASLECFYSCKYFAGEKTRHIFFFCFLILFVLRNFVGFFNCLFKSPQLYSNHTINERNWLPLHISTIQCDPCGNSNDGKIPDIEINGLFPCNVLGL
jgi:hypothetical protein